MDRAGTVVHNLSLYPVPRALPLAVALLLALPAAAHPAPAPTPEPLLVGAATDHYPYSYLDGNNRITGFAVDLFDEVARVGGLNIKRILGSSADLNRRFFAGEFPVAQVYTFVPGGQGETIFSAPYLTLKGALFVRRDRSRPIASLADLAGRSVIVGRGSSGESFLRRSGIPVTLVEARTPLLSFLDLEMSTRLKARMEGLGVQFRMPATVESVDVEEGRVTVGLKGGDTLAAAALLVASGRSANTAGMGLEEAGLVRRTADPRDGRIARVHATPKGRRVLQRARERRIARLAERLSQLEPDEVALVRQAAELVDAALAGRPFKAR